MQATTAAHASLEALLAEMAELWNRHDIEAHARLWVEDLDFVNVAGIDRHGRGELAAELAYLHAGRFRDTRIEVLDREVRYLTPEIAVVLVWWEMTGDPGIPGYPTRDGKRRGVFTHVAKKK